MGEILGRAGIDWIRADIAIQLIVGGEDRTPFEGGSGRGDKVGGARVGAARAADERTTTREQVRSGVICIGRDGREPKNEPHPLYSKIRIRPASVRTLPVAGTKRMQSTSAPRERSLASVMRGAGSGRRVERDDVEPVSHHRDCVRGVESAKAGIAANDSDESREAGRGLYGAQLLIK